MHMDDTDTGRIGFLGHLYNFSIGLQPIFVV
jgi:hypothetical protein